jgi:ABC-type branched-subunit amino acid transport system substrate-binding protein
MAKPIRIGMLNDMADGPPADGSSTPGDMSPWIARAVADVTAAGRLDRPAEFVHAHGLGLPGGTAAAVERAYAALAEQDVLLIVGPAIGDNALIATPQAEALRIPTLNWAGAERARGEWMFHLQVGSHEDESLVIARHLAALGARRLAVAFDRSPIGRRHLAFLLDEAELLGLTITGTAGLSPLAEEAGEAVAGLLAGKPDGVVYLGLGISAPAVARALSASGWQGPRIMNTAGIRGYQPGFAEVIDGWLYVDMFSDTNQTLIALRAALGLSHLQSLAAAKGHDLGRLVAEGLARAPALTRDGVRQGLEAVKWLPAAEGHEGTLLGFGVQDRGALHGRYLVVRQWLGGQTVEA